MIARRQQVALAVTALLTAAAACQAHQREHPVRTGHPAPAASSAPGFTLVATGAVLPNGSVVDRAAFDAHGAGHDFRPMLEGGKRLVAGADVALCHLATVYGPDGAPSANGTVKAPPGLAEGLAATGYDSCATASGHSLDGGAEGIRRTLDALDRAGVRHAGSARTQAEARSVTLLRAGGARVAHLAYTHGTDGPPVPGQPWAVGLIDADRILADARAARTAGADVVVVSLNWGTEWQEQPDARQLALAERLTAARTGGRPAVDLILGAHAHVPQPYEKVNGTWVVYGLGDQVAGATADPHGVRDPRGNQSTLARFTFAPPARPGDRWQVTRAEFVPELFDVDAGRVVDLGDALVQGADVRAVRDRIRDVSLSRGAAGAGLRMGR